MFNPWNPWEWLYTQFGESLLNCHNKSVVPDIKYRKIFVDRPLTDTTFLVLVIEAH